MGQASQILSMRLTLAEAMSGHARPLFQGAGTFQVSSAVEFTQEPMRQSIPFGEIAGWKHLPAKLRDGEGPPSLHF